VLAAHITFISSFYIEKFNNATSTLLVGMELEALEDDACKM